MKNDWLSPENTSNVNNALQSKMLPGSCSARNEMKVFFTFGTQLVIRKNKLKPAGLFTMPRKSSTYVYADTRNQRYPSCSYFVHQTHMHLATNETNNPKPRGRKIKSSFEAQWTYNKERLHKAFVHWPFTDTLAARYRNCVLLRCLTTVL